MYRKFIVSSEIKTQTNKQTNKTNPSIVLWVERRVDDKSFLVGTKQYLSRRRTFEGVYKALPPFNLSFSALSGYKGDLDSS